MFGLAELLSGDHTPRVGLRLRLFSCSVVASDRRGSVESWASVFVSLAGRSTLGDWPRAGQLASPWPDGGQSHVFKRSEVTCFCCDWPDWPSDFGMEPICQFADFNDAAAWYTTAF